MGALQFLVHRKREPVPGSLDFNRVKVLFIRQDRIGDVLVSTPLFSALSSQYPGMTIDILLSRNNFFVLDNEPTVRKRWIYTKEFISTVRLVRNIRAERYDFVVDLMDNPSATSTVAVILANGNWNVGLDKENAFVYDIVVPMLSRRDTHIVDRLAKLLEAFAVSVDTSALRIKYATTSASDDRVSEFLELHHADPGLVGINISAGSDTRFWGIANYRELIARLAAERREIRLLLLSKVADRSRAEEIARGNPQVLIAPETTFDEFAAFIKRLQILITPDTSAVHLAAAFGIPSVILYVQSDANLRIWEPFNTEFEAIVTPVDDISSIAVPRVFDAYLRLRKKIYPAPAGKSERQA